MNLNYFGFSLNNWFESNIIDFQKEFNDFSSIKEFHISNQFFIVIFKSQKVFISFRKNSNLYFNPNVFLKNDLKIEKISIGENHLIFNSSNNKKKQIFDFFKKKHNFFKLYSYFQDSKLFGIGSNKFNQLGFENSKLKSTLNVIEIKNLNFEKIKSIGCGNNHSIIVTS